MARHFKRVLPKGFTLVELLIVVAIIGVLSSIGVPTFRKMVTKAKKSEAKVALGGIFTVESAFFTEYNTYGNRLNRVGFEIEGTQRLYHVGFTDSNCAQLDLRPTQGNSVGATLANQYATYFTVDENVEANKKITVSERQTKTGSNNNQSLGFQCFAANVVEDGTSYVASATGNIAPGVLANTATTNCTANCQDVWTINEKRTLANTLDGTN